MVFGDVVQISHVGGDVTVGLDRPPYRVIPVDSAPLSLSVSQARAQPSRLLLARHQVVPFTGRADTLNALAAWISGPEPVAALLVHGAGGQGKTRLAAEVAGRCSRAGWAVWKVSHTPTPMAGPAPLSRMELPGAAVLAIVDYADRWPASALLALLTHLQDLNTRANSQIRVLMLARSAGYWWPALADRADSDLGVDTNQLTLPPLAIDSDDDRTGLFTTAAAHFAAAMNVEDVGWPVPNLTGAGFTQVLAVHMAALATVDATRHRQEPPVRSDAISAYLLRREQTYWRELHTGTEALVQTPPEVMHRAVFTATLTGAQPRSDARQALTQAGFPASAEAADRIIDDHTVCYPPTGMSTVFEPLHPDRLGEDLLALSTPGHSHRGISNLERDWAPAAITGLLTPEGPQPPVWTPAAVTILVETAHRWPHISTSLLYPIIRRNPALAIAAGGTTLTRLAELPDVDQSALEAVEALLPHERHIDFDTAAAAITAVLTTRRLASITVPSARASLQLALGRRLAHAGDHEGALTADRAAVDVYRGLATTDPAAFEPNLARALTSYGNDLWKLGHQQEALAATREACEMHRRMAIANPTGHLPALPASLTNLGAMLSGLGLQREALAATEEAVAIHRELTQADPVTYLPALATSLDNLGVDLARSGEQEAALAAAEEAVEIYRRLAEAHPATHRPDLARSLSNLGMWRSSLGHREEALAATQEAVAMEQDLAIANPAAWLPSLAMSLTNLAADLSDMGRYEQALTVAEDSCATYRRLAAGRPSVYLRELSAALNNLGMTLAQLGRREEALAATEEAVAIRRDLAAANPTARLPDLAVSLSNLGIFLFRVGRREEALAATEEAVAIRRDLAAANPTAWLPDLTQSLTNLGGDLADLGRYDDALAISAEAARNSRRLADADPTAYLPDLALGMCAYARVRVAAGAELAEALPAIEEAVDIYEELFDQIPEAFSVALVGAYRTWIAVLEGLNRTEEAADIRRQLDEAGEAQE
ncbi:hypothetical protein GCM10009531_58860 [Actinoplanes capillaceus]